MMSNKQDKQARKEVQFSLDMLILQLISLSTKIQGDIAKGRNKTTDDLVGVSYGQTNITTNISNDDAGSVHLPTISQRNMN